MLFLNPWLLLGAIGIIVPICLHLFNRTKVKRIYFGAMIFLTSSFQERRRKIWAEEFLLLATRCLIFLLVALTFSRPFVEPSAHISQIVTAASGIVSIIILALAITLWQETRLRKRLLIGSVALAFFSLSSLLIDGFGFLLRNSQQNGKDIAIIIDSSSSMAIKDANGTITFDKAREEVEKFIEKAPRNDSFALIQGGTIPRALSATPLSDKKFLYSTLDALEAPEGTFDAPSAIALGVKVLSEGSRATKQIIIFGDGQSSGWQLQDEKSWIYVKELLKRFPREPRIIWRSMGLPEHLRNLTVSNITFSRPVIGTDRPVGIDVEISNNGLETVSVPSIMVAVEGRTYNDETPGTLEPGERKVISFSHRFRTKGTHSVKAILDLQDDLQSDNTLTKIAQVRSELSILVVENRGIKKLRNRPGAFIALALSPNGEILKTKKEHGTKTNSANAKTVPSPFSPVLIDAKELSTVKDLSVFDAIILADATEFDAQSASRLLNYCVKGGGIMAVTSERAKSSFYNNWKSFDSVPVMPLILEDDSPIKTEGIQIDPKAVSHSTLRELAANGDLGTAIFERIRITKESNTLNTDVAIRLSDGKPILAEKKIGYGRILQFCISLNPTSGNLVTRQSFLPMIHNLTYYLTRPIVPSLDVETSFSSTITLSHNEVAGEDIEGLERVVRHNGKDGRLLSSAIDKTINFNHQSRPLAPGVSDNEIVHAEWRGTLRVPTSGKYKISVNSSFGGKARVSFPNDKKNFGFSSSSISIDLSNGELHDIVITYEGKNKAGLSLIWTGGGVFNQIIKSEFLSPIRSEQTKTTDKFPTIVKSKTGIEYDATLVRNRESVSLSIPSRLSQGQYEAYIPTSFSPRLEKIAQSSNTLSVVTFSIQTNPGESILNEVTEEEIASLSKLTDFQLAKNFDDLLRTSGGAKVGKELWRRAAWTLLVLLIGELLLSRWITKERKLGEEGTVPFENGSDKETKFSELLAEIKERGRP